MKSFGKLSSLFEVFLTACKCLSTHGCMCLLALCFSYQYSLGNAGKKAMTNAGNLSIPPQGQVSVLTQYQHFKYGD